ncbi:MAG: hypothetical protein ACREIZ_01475 [Candidatus Methylomirabilales bacterium]
MAKRFLTLFITASLLVGTSGWAQAGWRQDFERRGSSDYPGRGLVYPIYAVGKALYVFVFRPINLLACSAPEWTGCMPEDQRALGLEESYQQLEEVYQEAPSK